MTESRKEATTRKAGKLTILAVASTSIVGAAQTDNIELVSKENSNTAELLCSMRRERGAY